MLRHVLATALCLVAGPALARTAADDLWASWQGSVAATGGTLDARSETAGQALVLREVTLRIESGATIILDRMDLIPAEGDTVRIVIPPEAELAIESSTGGDPATPGRAVFALAVPGLVAEVTERGRNIGSVIRAPSVSVVLDRLEPAPPADQKLAIAFAAADLTFDWAQGQRDGGDFAESSLSVGTLHADLQADFPGQSRSDMALDLSGLSGGLNAFFPPSALNAPDPSADLGRFLATLEDGLVLDTSLQLDTISLVFDVEKEAEPPVLFRASANTSHAAFDLDRAGASYGFGLGAGRLFMQGDFPDQPIDEVDLSWQGARTSTSFGLQDMRGPQPWAFVVRLAGIALSEKLWALADPKAALPHDPATLILDIGGLYALDPSVMAPGGMPAAGEDLPFSTFSLKLNELVVQGLGLGFTGTGGLDFDFSDLVTFEGTPAPSGRMDFVTTGATALIERLVAAGLVPMEEATSMRFGLMFLGRAGAQPDTLETSIEFKDKQFFLNGQKIR